MEPVWRCIEFSQIDYPQALALQTALAQAVNAGRLTDNVLLLLEHPPVFTLGRRGGRDNLRVTDAYLADRGIPVIPIDRGGNITYHGPGQVVGYPIFHLARNGLDVTGYVNLLETLMIQTAADFGVCACRDSRNHGAWVGNGKLGSIGICLRHGVGFHGFALNANLDLTPFGWINPCGLQGIHMTSLSRETGNAVNASDVRGAVKLHFSQLMNTELHSAQPAWLDRYCA